MGPRFTTLFLDVITPTLIQCPWINTYFITRPARSTYSASKFAIEAVHESLSHELVTFGIKVLIVEPGVFRTPFSSRIMMPAAHAQTGGVSAEYKGTAVDKLVSVTHAVNLVRGAEWAKGDPDKAARFIVEAVRDGHEYLRMPLGPDCVGALEEKIASLQGDLDKTRGVGMATNFD